MPCPGVGACRVYIYTIHRHVIASSAIIPSADVFLSALFCKVTWMFASYERPCRLSQLYAMPQSPRGIWRKREKRREACYETALEIRRRKARCMSSLFKFVTSSNQRSCKVHAIFKRPVYNFKSYKSPLNAHHSNY